MPECTREEPEQRAKPVPEQLETGVQTIDASAVWRYALSFLVQSKNVGALLHRPGNQVKAWQPEDLSHSR